MSYIYIGQYYHKYGKSLTDITEKKIGRTRDLAHREQALNSTKMTIGYMMTTAWQTDDDTNRIETALHALLDHNRLDDEWFEDHDDTLIDRVRKYMAIWEYPEVPMETLVKTDNNSKEDKDIIAKQRIRAIVEPHIIELRKNATKLLKGEFIDSFFPPQNKTYTIEITETGWKYDGVEYDTYNKAAKVIGKEIYGDGFTISVWIDNRLRIRTSGKSVQETLLDRQ